MILSDGNQMSAAHINATTKDTSCLINGFLVSFSLIVIFPLNRNTRSKTSTKAAYVVSIMFMRLTNLFFCPLVDIVLALHESFL